MPDLKPLYPYPGGKRGYIENISPYLQLTDTYVEPFFGGGAVFCFMYNLGRAKQFIINDAQSELMKIYRDIQSNPHPIIDEFIDLRSAWVGSSISGKKGSIMRFAISG